MQNQQQFLIDFYAKTDTGLVRSLSPNEDTILAQQWQRYSSDGKPLGEASLFVVADGMGGHANGQEASFRAAHALANFVIPAVEKGELDQQALADLMVNGVKQANKAVIQLNDETGEDSGTTITAVLVVDAMAYVVNVGDSRTYLSRQSEGGLKKITKDHSLVQRLVDTNVISPDEVYTHFQRNQIYRCLGEKLAVQVDLFTVSLQPSDKLLLCSDGLWEMVRDPQIQSILDATSEPQVAAEQLVFAANTNGGADNISAIVVHVYVPFLPAPGTMLKPSDAPSPVTVLPAMSIMKGLAVPLAACVRVWCVWCGFLVTCVLPRLWAFCVSTLKELVEIEVEDNVDESLSPYVLVTDKDGIVHVVYCQVPEFGRGAYGRSIPPMPSR